MAWSDRPYNRENDSGIPPVQFRFPPLTALVGGIVGACLLVFLLQAFTGHGTSGVTEWGFLTTTDHRAVTQPWRWITYQYLHADAAHFFFNMLALYFFMPTLETLWGWKSALAFYTLGGTVAGIFYVLLSLVYPSAGLLGASGSVLAVIGAVALLSPNRQVILLVFPVPIRVFAGLIGAFYLLSTIADKDLSNAAHLGGLAFGFVAPWVGGPVASRWLRNLERNRVRSRARSVELEQEMVDRILTKVHRTGMQSLTRTERRQLHNATKHQQVRDSEIAQQRRRR